MVKKKKMWGARFTQEVDSAFWNFSSSIGYDKELLVYDVMGSIAHVKMLLKCRIIPKQEATSILNALSQMSKQIKAGKFVIDKKAEDVHTAVFCELQKRTGKAADFLHTARSRNDQVALDLRMYCKDKLAGLVKIIVELQSALVDFADKNIDVIMPGYTHTQHAVCILLSHQILAYVNMLERDKNRIKQALERTDEMPLGSCAMAGTSLTIDRAYVAKLLGFSKISPNSIDAVSDRDFVVEILAAISILFMHLSRISQDFIFYSCSDIGFLKIAEAYCTGSSIMPQKKNPDSLELIRATTARVYGNLNSVLTMMKGLPLSYNRDMQFDKPPLFDGLFNTEQCLQILTGIVKSTKVDRKKIEQALSADESIYALDIAEYLVRKRMPFYQAHRVVGKIVAYALGKGCKISQLTMSEFKRFNSTIGEDVFKLLDAKRSVMLKKSIGSTNPLLVRQKINSWRKKLAGE